MEIKSLNDRFYTLIMGHGGPTVLAAKIIYEWYPNGGFTKGEMLWAEKILNDVQNMPSEQRYTYVPRVNTKRKKQGLIGPKIKKPAHRPIISIKEAVFIQRNWLTMTTQEIADKLGRTYESILYFARQHRDILGYKEPFGRNQYSKKSRS